MAEEPTKHIFKYNPAFLSAEERIEAFVVRIAEFKLIMQTVRENVTGSNQHVMVIGPRGIGKTMLVWRVVDEIRRDAELSGRWYPIVYGEESYQVHSAGEFWLEAIFHLGEQTGEEKWQRTYEELREERDEVRLRERALSQLMDFADGEGKRLLLVVENMNMLLGEQMSDDEGWALRHTLLNEPRVMVLGSAPTRFDEMENVRKPMYELFKVYELEPLNEEECRAVWRSVTGQEAGDGRVRPLQILTGGNPRLMSIISVFAAKMSLKELMRDLIKLVDENTEYFKSHLDGLAPKERKVYLGLAELWDPATAREVAKACRLGINEVSANLVRLKDKGAVVEAGAEGKAKIYQVAERMYNIYYLMRRRGAPSARVRAVVRFMVTFYKEEELLSAVQRITEEACKLEENARCEHYLLYEGILACQSDQKFRNRLIEITPEEFIGAADIPASLKVLIDKDKFAQKDAGVTKPKSEWLIDEAERLWGEGIRLDEALQLCKQAIGIDAKYALAWVMQGYILEALTRYDEAEESYREVVRLLPEVWGGWLILGSLLHRKLERYDEAENAYRRAIELDANVSETWVSLGFLLAEALKKYDEAEEAFRRAVEIDKCCGRGWGGLASLLHRNLGRYEEAEDAYRKALDCLPEWAWALGNLGDLLFEQFRRYDEAEECYRQALELEPEVAYGWMKLGQVLQEGLGRREEAANAFRKAVEIDGSTWRAWIGLGDMLKGNGELEEAEQAFRQAVEESGNAMYALVSLGLFLQFYANKGEEAATVYQRIVEQSPDSVIGYGLVGQSEYSLGRLKEARAHLEKAKQLEAKGSFHILLLIDTYWQLGQYEEAVQLLKEHMKNTNEVQEEGDALNDAVINLTATGLGGAALKVICDSTGAKFLEPLIVGLRLYLGEEVRAAAEIMEIGKDIVKRIEARKAEIEKKKSVKKTGKKGAKRKPAGSG